MRRPELRHAQDASPHTDHASPATPRLIGGSGLRARSGQSHRLTYVLEDGTSTMTIHATSEYWTITDHNRAPRAKGAGERLQKLLLTSAAAAADSVDVGIRLTASAPVLAAEYAERLPGLMEVGPAFHTALRCTVPASASVRSWWPPTGSRARDPLPRPADLNGSSRLR